MFRFHLKSFLVFLLIFCIEIAIALWVNDVIIRPYGGDTLVILLLYYFLKSFLNIKPIINILGVTAFAFIIEFAQFFNLVSHLGLQHNRFWVIVIGNSFHRLDLVAYLVGAVILVLIEVIPKQNLK